MTTFTLAVPPSAADWSELFNDEEFTDIAGGLFVSGRSGNRWLLTLTWQGLQSDNRRALFGQRAALGGRRHRLRVPLVSMLGYAVAGSPNGSPQLVGAHAAGATSLDFDNTSGSVSGFLLRGDFISVGNELKMVTADVDTTTGAGTIPIWPELHQDYVNNAPINYSTPSGDFFQRSSQGFEWEPSADPGEFVVRSPVLVLEEDIRA